MNLLAEKSGAPALYDVTLPLAIRDLDTIFRFI
jgi:hypothetical protein